MSKMSVHVGGWPLLITVLLCVFKITNVINIGWIWCFCPFWLPVLIVTGIIFIFLLISMITYTLTNLFK
jgi:hypothetical protein